MHMFMKKSQFNLLKLASKFKKYADIDANEIKQSIQDYITQQVANAASNTNYTGVMDFNSKLMEGETLSLNVTRDGDDVAVSSVSCNPSEIAGRFNGLQNQIKQYLQKNIELYTSKHNGEDVDYDNFTITLIYHGRMSA